MKCPYCSKENAEDAITCTCGFQFKGYEESNEPFKANDNSEYSKKTGGQLQGFAWLDRAFWSFDRMITVKIIPFAFKIVLVLIAIVSFIWSIGIYHGAKFMTNEAIAFLIGLIAFGLINVVGFVLARLWFEMMIVFFKIWENTSYLRKQ